VGSGFHRGFTQVAAKILSMPEIDVPGPPKRSHPEADPGYQQSCASKGVQLHFLLRLAPIVGLDQYKIVIGSAFQAARPLGAFAQLSSE